MFEMANASISASQRIFYDRNSKEWTIHPDCLAINFIFSCNFTFNIVCYACISLAMPTADLSWSGLWSHVV